MSLEQVIAENTAAMTKMSELMAQMLSAASGAPAVKGDDEEKPKRTRTTKSKDDAQSDSKEDEKSKAAGADEKTGPTYEEVKALCSAWLGEFSKVEGDPETAARKESFKAAITKLTGKEGALLSDVKTEELHRVVTWLENKKAKDNGHGAGRLTEKPAAKPASTDDEI